ncbi:hypothetical protein FISHEDRAFT_69448 [Fistulina hepatica ATCC 64428]|uniref:CHCH domain-containing protein n=1 Tax=Fistulina hepatica ATCC 64428 TaxID=1128425 RepID=A0A0D7AM94_9AGAR|nr:hypothetical protein FISHEDRAFT_69448 [Fistulina hepatica ATCC 64428]
MSDGAPNLPRPEDNVEPEPYRKHFQNKQASQFVDPCVAASKASMECMNRNDYDRNECMEYFQAYRDCKKTWMEQRKNDRQTGRYTGP